MSHPEVPFSARQCGRHQRIDNDFPSTARIALVHLLLGLVERNFVNGWRAIARELQRIDRQPPGSYESASGADIAEADAQQILHNLKWDKAYDFCERLHSYLAHDAIDEASTPNEVVTREEVQRFITSELQRIFLEEGLAFEFSDGIVRRRGRKHTVDQAARAQVVLGDNRLVEARRHFEKALRFFRHPTDPDYENCVKEAVCAVEAAGKTLFPIAKAATLADLCKWMLQTSDYSAPRPLVKMIENLYACRSSSKGVAHGAADGVAPTVEEAEYVLSVAASQIIYMVGLECSIREVPF